MIKREVYRPREDSFLLSNSLINFLEKKLRKKKITSILFFDVGCGSGFQTERLIPFCKKHNIKLNVVFTDINVNAIRTCMKKFENYESFLFVIADVLSPFKFIQKEINKFDLVIFAFNPPYLPKDKEYSLKERYDDLVSKSEGTETTVKFLKDLKNCQFSKAFFIASSLSNLNKIFIELKKLKYEWRICGKIHIFFEDIFVFCLQGSYHAEHRRENKGC